MFFNFFDTPKYARKLREPRPIWEWSEKPVFPEIEMKKAEKELTFQEAFDKVFEKLDRIEALLEEKNNEGK